MSKVIFESEEEAKEFVFKCLDSYDSIREHMVITIKEKGYIRKSVVEEAEEIAHIIGTFFSENDEPYELSVEEFNMMYNAIQYLKAENERLKK